MGKGNENSCQNANHNKTMYPKKKIILDSAPGKSVSVFRTKCHGKPTESWWRGKQALISTLQSKPKLYAEAMNSLEKSRAA